LLHIGHMSAVFEHDEACAKGVRDRPGRLERDRILASVHDEGRDAHPAERRA